MDKKQKSKHRVEQDAAPSFVRSQEGRDNSGVVSAKPRVITGSDDATAHKWYPGRRNPPKDWELGFDDNPPRKKAE